MRHEESYKVIAVSDCKVITFKDAKYNLYELDLCGEFEIILKGGKYYAKRIDTKCPTSYGDNDTQGCEADFISDLVLENILQS